MNGWGQESHDLWESFRAAARRGIAEGRRRSLPESDPRHLPADDTDDTEESDE